jgi:hypothetical protein
MESGMDPLISLVIGVVAFVMLDAFVIAVLLVLVPAALVIRDTVARLARRLSSVRAAATGRPVGRAGLASEPR